MKNKKKLWRNIKSNWVLYLFVLPVLIYYVVFHYVPIYGVQIAFQDYRVGEMFGESEWVGFKHFIRFFKSAWFRTVLTNTLSISLLNLVIGFPVPIILALLLNEVKNMKIRKTIQTVTYAPHFISMVVLCGTVTMFLSPSTGILGLAINSVRESMGLNQINLLSVGSAFKWIYVLSGVWQGAGWGSVIYFAALSGVDPQLLEAAKIDGANKVQCIWNINLPVLVPTIVIQLILQCGRLLSVGFEKTYLLQNDSIIRASEVISTYVYRAGLQGAQYSFGTAVGLFNSAVNAIMLITVNTISHKLDKDSGLW
ncbi:MAG: sugar ABC transporter permease [Lachnospiraceae bacterium]|nr:sugar ABC transporter permease [Lachnospiraceae bacterium]